MPTCPTCGAQTGSPNETSGADQGMAAARRRFGDQQSAGPRMTDEVREQLRRRGLLPAEH
jgi:hypothetical protein